MANGDDRDLNMRSRNTSAVWWTVLAVIAVALIVWWIVAANTVSTVTPGTPNTGNTGSTTQSSQQMI